MSEDENAYKVSEIDPRVEHNVNIMGREIPVNSFEIEENFINSFKDSYLAEKYEIKEIR
jgi:hypothetical protein